MCSVSKMHILCKTSIKKIPLSMNMNANVLNRITLPQAYGILY